MEPRERLKTIGGDYYDAQDNQREIDRLVKQRVMVGNVTPGVSGIIVIILSVVILMATNGFLAKDIRSGRILKFTQSDKDASRGTLEIIQGDSVTEPKEEASNNPNELRTPKADDAT